MKDLKMRYMSALRTFEAEPNTDNVENVDHFYRQLVVKGVTPWLCTDHAPVWKCPKGSKLHAAGFDTAPYAEWQSKDGTITRQDAVKELSP